MPTKTITASNIKWMNLSISRANQKLTQQMTSPFSIRDANGNIICQATKQMNGARLSAPELFAGDPPSVIIQGNPHVWAVGDIVEWNVVNGVFVITNITPTAVANKAQKNIAFTPMFTLSPYQYQCCHRQHFLRVPNTRRIEAMGNSLLTGPINIKHLRNFIRAVFSWGGITGNRVLWRIENTSDIVVLHGFQAAISELHKSNVIGALNKLRPIKGLGQFSYSSKNLRMLAPHLCAIYDKYVKKHLKSLYPSLSHSALFLAYCEFCVEKATELTLKKIVKGDFLHTNDCLGVTAVTTHAQSEESHWTAADVDMSCFAWLKGWCCGNANVCKEEFSGLSTHVSDSSSDSNSDLDDLVRVIYIQSVTIEESSYQSFGSCYESRLTIKRTNKGFCWGAKRSESDGPAEVISNRLAVQDDTGVSYVPLPNQLEATVESIFDELSISYLSLKEQCKNIPERFRTAPSSLVIKIRTADYEWEINTTGNPADGFNLPSVIQKLLNLPLC